MRLGSPDSRGVLVVAPSGVGGIAAYVESMLEQLPTRTLSTRTPGSSLGERLRTMAAAAWQIVRLRRTHAVLHLHSSFGWSFFEKALLAWFGRACGYRVIVHIHGSSFDDFARRSSLRVFVRRSLEAADAVVV